MLKEYINNTEFKLKDRAGVNERYKGYKDQEFKELIKEYEGLIKDHLYELDELIFDQCFNGDSHYFFEGYTPDSKTNIRSYKTRINQITEILNRNFIEYIIGDQNKNKLRIFNIKFYLKYYTRINKIMLKALKRVIKHYSK